MPLMRKPQNRRTSSGGCCFSRFLSLSLLAVVGCLAVRTVFARGPEPNRASAREQEAAADVRKSRVLRLATGTYVEVRLTDGQKIEGRLGDLVEDGFMLQTVNENKLTERLVRFEELQSVKPVGDTSGHNGSVDISFDQGKVILELAAGGVALGLTVDTDTQDGKKKITHVTLSRNSKETPP
jgi:hypothetical protein